MAEAAVGVKHRSVDPGVVGSVPGRPDHCVDLQLAAVGEGDGTAGGVDDARLSSRRRTSLERRAGLTRSACRGRAVRRPSRVSTVLSSSPSFVSHQKMSRPRSLCGSGVWRDPIASCTVWVATSSLAIWKPVLPPPDDEDRPSWDVARRSVAGAVRLERPRASSARRLRHARPLKGPVATTTWSASYVRSTRAGRCRCSRLQASGPRCPSSIGSSNIAAYSLR